MVEDPEKSAVLVLTSLLFVLTASAVTFNVNVEGDMRAAVYSTNFTENVSKYQEVNLTAENTGSIGCDFRLRGVFSYRNRTETVYSPTKNLWPGESGFLQIHYAPLNYTGRVNTELFLNYCDTRKPLRNFSFTVKESKTVEKTVKSTTLSANPDKAVVEIDTQRAVLVPMEKPAGWKVASATLKNGRAELDYNPTLFDSSEEIRYTVLNKTTGEPLGTTRVKLKVKETWVDNLEENKWKILLVLSVLANLILLNRRRIRTAAERFKGYYDKLNNR